MRSALYRKGDRFYAPGFEVYADLRSLGSSALPNNDLVHWHDYCEVELIISGSGEHEFNNRCYTLEEGCVYLITPLDFHAVRANEGDSLTLCHIQFGGTVLGSEMMRRIMADRDAAGGIAVRLNPTELKSVRSAFEEVLEEFSARRKDGITMLRACLERLCVLILREAEQEENLLSSGMRTIDHAAINQAIQYVQYHFRSDITLSDAAKQAHLSNNYFGELFHAHLGMSFNEYLRMQRLKYAHHLLTETQLSVSEIVRESGFRSLSYFSQIFRALYGVSPTKLRQQQRSREEES